MPRFILVWLAAAGSYVLLAGQFSPEELGAAVLCGLFAALWSASLNRAASIHFRFERGTLAAAIHAIAGLPAATVRVAAAFVRVLVTRKIAATWFAQTMREPFIHGHRLNSTDAGRRATAILARSLAPDSFIVRIPEGREEIDVHNLLGTPSGKSARWAI